jgi:hypothetical protein
LAKQGTKLGERIEHIEKVVEGGNDPIRIFACAGIQDMLAQLDFDDLTDEEVVTIHHTLAHAYGRKLLGTPPPLRLVPKLPDRAEKLGS